MQNSLTVSFVQLLDIRLEVFDTFLQTDYYSAHCMGGSESSIGAGKVYSADEIGTFTCLVDVKITHSLPIDLKLL